MRVDLKYLLLFSLIFSILFGQNGFSQNSTSKVLSATVYKEKAIVESGSTVFNVLKVVNNGTINQDFIVDFFYPENWNVFCDKGKVYSIAGGQEFSVPFRVSPAKNTKGGVSNVLGANIKKPDGEFITSVFFYVNIKAISKIFSRPVTRFEYFDAETKRSEIVIRLNNKGNQDEILYFDISSTKNLYVEGEEDNQLLTSVLLPINTDTIIRIPVKKVRDRASVVERDIESAEIIISNQDTTIKHHMWYKEIPNFYRNTKGYKSPLDMELRFANLIRGRDIGMALRIMGTVLLKKEREVAYNVHFSPFDRETWKYSIWQVKYKDKNLEVLAGDVVGVGYLSYGKGVRATYSLGNHLISAAGTYNLFTKSYSAGVGYQTVIKGYSINSEFGYGHNGFNNSNSIVGLAGVGFKFRQTNLGVNLAGSSTNFVNEQITRNGGFGQAIVSGKYGAVEYRLSGIYASRGFTGRLSANESLNADVTYALSEKSFAVFSVAHNKYLNNFRVGILDTSSIDDFMSSDIVKVSYNVLSSPNVRLFISNEWIKYASNHFLLAENGEFFETTSSYVVIGARVLQEKFNNSITPKVSIGYTGFNSYYRYYRNELYPAENIPGTYLNAVFGINYDKRLWGINTSYFYGPHSFYQQYYYFYNDAFQKYIMISPYANIFLWDNRMQLNTRASYLRFSEPESERFNFNLNIIWSLKKGWTIKAYSNYYSSGRYNAFDHDFKNYRGFYIGGAIRKTFDIQQPRAKFYDITVVFFKDFDGNGTKEDNEPGVRSVLVKVARDTSFSTEEKVTFRDIELLTDRDGAIVCEKLQAGNYLLKYTALDKSIDNYKPLISEKVIEVNESKTIYIPYLQRYKVFGKVLIQRDKFSRLGEISPQNVKITATDSSGTVFSTYSLSDGSYSLLVPSTEGRYTIHVNNIFSKNFDLQQNDFVIEFDGFKEYIIDFIFNERKRQINFNGANNDGNNGATMDGVLIDPNTVPKNNTTTENKTSNPSVKSFSSMSSEAEVDTNAVVKYIDKLFDGLDDDDSYEDPVIRDNSTPENKETGNTEDTSTSGDAKNESEQPGVEIPDKNNDVTIPSDTEAIDESGGEAEVEKAEEGEVESGEDKIVLDDDPNLVPVSEITRMDSHLRIRLYKYALPRFSKYTFSGIDGVICVKNKTGEDFLYYSQPVESEKEAAKLLKKILKLDFDQASIVTISNGLEEGGI